MLDKLKELWSKWKVHVTIAGGVLVVATAYGTCQYEPPELQVSDTIENTNDETTSSDE